MVRTHVWRRWVLTAVCSTSLCFTATATAFAQTASTDNSSDSGAFSLQITPSPLVTNVNPGVPTQVELRIRNAGVATEDLKIQPRSFTIDNNTGAIKLDDTLTAEIAPWISFSQSKFSIAPGQWFSEEVKFSFPKDTGFSYSFAIVISRANQPTPTGGGRLLEGSVADFTLVNVNKPGAARSASIVSLTTSQGIYEYLPATINLKLKNTGNVIMQSYGDVFIQRGDGVTPKPLATLSANPGKGYMIPGEVRTFPIQWNDGFPAYTTQTLSDGSTKQTLSWNWSKLSSFRIGRYTAKLVAVYNNGTYDVPLNASVSFWVIPWKILLGVLVFVVLILFGVWSFIRKTTGIFRKKPTRRRR